MKPKSAKKRPVPAPEPPKKPTPFTLQRAAEIRRLFGRGCTHRETAAAIGIALYSLREWLANLKHQHPDLHETIQASRGAKRPLTMGAAKATEGFRDLYVTLPESLVTVEMRLPSPMTPGDHSYLHSLLKAMRPALTKPKA